jgi:O-antigen ligase
MSDNATKALVTLGAAALFLCGILLLRPDYFATSSGLAVLIGAEILIAAVANYRKAFFPLVLVCFLFAGATLPFHGALLQARWLVLAAGAVAGLATYMKTHNHSFGTFHLVALCCVLSGFVSALVSEYPNESLLKAVSLFLLFLYGAAGARTAVPMQPERFFLKLVTGVEILIWFSVICYLPLRFEVFGNPNSLGAIMGVVVVPVLLWGFLTAQARARRLRLGIELILAILLLLSSFARAAIAAAVISSLLVCLTTRQYRLLVRGAGIAAVLAICVILFVPQHTSAPTWDGAVPMTDVFLYKGKRNEGVFGSRRGVWQQTWDVIRDKPWFGSGFGTSAVTKDMTMLQYAEHHIDTWVTREHGNSYLAIAEWTGILGVIPFYLLIVLAVLNVRAVFSWVHRTQDVFSPALLAAAIVTAGLIDALFEDWLFAVGYYLCVLFWAMAFILVDVLPRRSVAYSPDPGTLMAVQPHAAVAPTR